MDRLSQRISEHNKFITEEFLIISSGSQLIYISISDLSSGSYFVEYAMKDDDKEIVRFIKN